MPTELLVKAKDGGPAKRYLLLKMGKGSEPIKFAQVHLLCRGRSGGGHVFENSRGRVWETGPGIEPRKIEVDDLEVGLSWVPWERPLARRRRN